ncbi:MAG: rRNA pseudouridine synthase [Deltaproteobacteria bacterium]|nr:rRNA pseudouridine synthase [Deltaproteobacteria bacterium]
MAHYFALHKPSGCITARSDHRGRPTVYDHVPVAWRGVPHVGRLDQATEGLLLFTNDGRLAQAVLNPGFAGLAPPSAVPPLEKVYHVKVRGRIPPDDPVLALLERPLCYPDGVETRPARVRWLGPRTRATWIEVTVREGRTHQVRLLCGRSGLQVVKLRREAVGPVRLGDLPPRWCRPLEEAEVAALYAAVLPLDPRPPLDALPDPLLSSETP